MTVGAQLHTNAGDGSSDEVSRADLEARIKLLEARVARERDAREQAERISERGMRDLWETNRHLEARVAERTEELQRLLVAATQTSDAQEQFLGSLGHDLTTPLHAVLGLLELIDSDSLSPTDRDHFAEVRLNTVRLSELLRDLIALAGAGQPSASSDMTVSTGWEWLDALIASRTRQAAKAGQLLIPTLIGHGEVPVRSDWARLGRIADSVLDHVHRHGDPGSIEVTVIVNADGVTVRVADAGPEMSPEERAVATEPYVHRRERGEMDLGLAIGERLAISGGGDFALHGVTGRTQITFGLPRTN